MNQLTLTTPDDWHLHLRDGVAMASVLTHTAEFYGRALVMPNLDRPVLSVAEAERYRQRILAALSAGSSFDPMMTLYLTAETTTEQIMEAGQSEIVRAVKLYPSGATTNSETGVRSINQCDRIFSLMQRLGIPLSVHGEVPEPEVDIFDREKVFVDRVLSLLIKRYPELKIVMEHLSCKESVAFIRESSPFLAATITPHHLWLNRNDLLAGGFNPHYYCFPIVKGETDRRAVVEAATSGDPKFFLGTDSAPHARIAKESAKAKAGIFNASVSLSLYAELFEKEGKLDRLEGFSSFYGADFYGIPRNQTTVVLKKERREIPEAYPFGDQQVVPMRAGGSISWAVVSQSPRISIGPA